jgi:adenylate cyclase
MLARDEPAVFVIEDAHWVDPTSEALLAEFLSVVPRTRSVAIITYRPEYAGPLSRSTGAQTIALAPLDDSHIGSLIAELLGPHPSVAGLANRIAGRASGNPFFVEEIVRDLVDRSVLQGQRGSYTCEDDATDVDVPPTVQAAIAARIDRLTPDAKQTLNAAAVIGLRFDEATLNALVDGAALAPLIEAELIDQVAFTPNPEFAFHHPLIRAVAHRSQLTSAKAELHRRLAAVLVGEGHPEIPGEQAALIAEHYESAGDLEEAFAWHMRAGDLLRFRDIDASRLSWQRASQVADTMPAEHPSREALRIAPRALLIASNFRATGPVDDAGFEELRVLTDTAGDKLSLATALSGRVTTLAFRGRYGEALREANELVGVIQSIEDPILELTMLTGPAMAKLMCGDVAEGVWLADRMMEIADGDFLRGGFVIESPLTVAMMLRAAGLMCLGARGWKREMDEAEALCREYAPVGEAVAVSWKYGLCVAMGAVLVDSSVIGVVTDIVARAEQCGDDLAVETAGFLQGICLAQLGGPDRQRGLTLLAAAREAATQDRVIAAVLQMSDRETAMETAQNGDWDAAIEMLSSLSGRDTVPRAFEPVGVEALVETLVARGAPADLVAAQAEIDRLVAAPAEPGVVLPGIVLARLRALLARARGDEEGYRQYTTQYLAAATEAGYEGHIAKAEAMA